MKHFVNILFLLLATFFCACSDELYFEHMSLTPRALGITAGGTLQTGKMNLTFEADPSAQQSFNVKAVNTQWSIDNPALWLTLSTTSGSETSTVTLTAAPNPTIESRVAVLKLVSHEEELPVAREIIAVTQRGQVPYITPDENSVTFSGAAGSQEIGVATNLPEWEVSTTDDWLTASRQGGKLFFGVKENTGAERRGYITIGKGETKATVTVTQHEANVTQLTSLDTYPVDGGTQTLSFKAEASWTASTTYSWIKVYPTNGTAGNNAVTVEVARNTSTAPLTGSLYIRIGTKEKLRVELSQHGVDITASPDKLGFESIGGKQTFKVKANTAWKLDVSEQWVTCTPMQGEVGETEVQVEVNDVGDTMPRSGTIAVCLHDADIPLATVEVQQEGHPIPSLPLMLEYHVMGGTQDVDITTSGSWTVTASEAWIHPSPLSGKGEGVLQIAVDENPDKEPRTSTVTVKVGNTEKNIAIQQAGRIITISCGDAVNRSTPCSVEVSLTANGSWTAAVDEECKEWMSVTPETGEGDAGLTVSFTDNLSSLPRTGSLTVESGNEGAELSFTQPGKYLTLSASAVTFFANGGQAEPIEITTDGRPVASVSDEGWLTAEIKDGKLFITATPNTGYVSRDGTVTVTLEGVTASESLARTVTVTQVAADFLSVTPTSIAAEDSKEHIYSVSVESNTSWTVTSSESWATLSATKGSGNGSFSVTVSDNASASARPKAASVTVTAGSVTKTITVTQPGRYLRLSSNSLSFGKAGGTDNSIVVSTDGTVQATPSAGWLTATVSDGKLSVTADKNIAVESRSGTVIVTVTGITGELSETVTVIQNPDDVTLSVTPTSIAAEDSKEHSYSVSVESNTSWTVTSSESWITLSTTKGSGNGAFSVMVSDNASASARPKAATVTVTAGSVTKNITVTQPGRYLRLSSNSLSFGKAGGTDNSIVVSTDGTVKATPSESWLTATVSSSKLSVTAAKNTAIESRSGTVTVTVTGITGDVSETVTITQAAALLPSVSAVTVSNIDKYSFTASATYTSDFEVTECGFCYSLTNGTPTINDTVVKAESLDGITITGLTSARTYYIRAYAKSAVGIGYGEVKAVTTKGAKPGEDDNGMPAT